jgi:hypothetical protein
MGGGDFFDDGLTEREEFSAFLPDSDFLGDSAFLVSDFLTIFFCNFLVIKKKLKNL